MGRERGLFWDGEGEDIHIMIQLPKNGTCVMNYDVAIGEKREGGMRWRRRPSGKWEMWQQHSRPPFLPSFLPSSPAALLLAVAQPLQ